MVKAQGLQTLGQARAFLESSQLEALPTPRFRAPGPRRRLGRTINRLHKLHKAQVIHRRGPWGMLRQLDSRDAIATWLKLNSLRDCRGGSCAAEC